MLAAALPATAATLAILGFAALETGGKPPLSVHPQNLSEAAALGSAAETVRRLSLGDSPYRIEAVRSELIASQVMHVTPLEAAVYSRRLELIQLLDSRGLLADDPLRRTLACLAADIGAADIAEHLARGRALDCEAGTTHLRIRARGQEGVTP